MQKLGAAWVECRNGVQGAWSGGGMGGRLRSVVQGWNGAGGGGNGA